MTYEKRLIDANKALRMIENSKQDNPYSGTLCGVAWEMAHNCAISCVEAESCTVDAVEVVHGRWIKRRFTDTLYGYECPICHTTWDAETNFCPNCGADMRERKEDGEH